MGVPLSEVVESLVVISGPSEESHQCCSRLHDKANEKSSVPVLLLHGQINDSKLCLCQMFPHENPTDLKWTSLVEGSYKLPFSLKWQKELYSHVK